jgi:hypothetical protein
VETRRVFGKAEKLDTRQTLILKKGEKDGLMIRNLERATKKRT